MTIYYDRKLAASHDFSVSLAHLCGVVKTIEPVFVSYFMVHSKYAVKMELPMSMQ